jgi:hypothetical protein
MGIARKRLTNATKGTRMAGFPSMNLAQHDLALVEARVPAPFAYSEGKTATLTRIKAAGSRSTPEALSGTVLQRNTG